MEYRIAHICDYEQAHFLSGFVSQMDRKAAWLKTTKCKSRFVAEKQAAQIDAAAIDTAAIAHLNLLPLTGSDRQIAWATSIRAKRLAAMMTATPSFSTNSEACGVIVDAKWWIDHRDLNDTDLVAKANTAIADLHVGTAAMIMAPSV
jgi:hypothetical protein